MDVRVWPGDPETVWDAVDAGARSIPDRPEVPPWRTPADFRTHVAVARGYAVIAVGLVILAVLFGGIGWSMTSNDLPGWAHVGKAVVGWVMVAIGAASLVGAVRLVRGGRRGWNDHVERTFERAVAGGIPTHAYRTAFSVPASEGSDRTVLLVDARLTDESASRVYAAAMTWIGRFGGDAKERDEAAQLFGSSRVVLPLTEVLGRDAEGAWIARDHSVGTPWRLLVPDADQADGFGLESVLVIRDPDREGEAEPLRLPKAGGVLDFVATLVLVVGAVAAYFWFRTSLGRANYWWDACADRFCAVGHDVRLMLLEALAVLVMVAGGIWAPRAFTRRRLHWVWALIGIGVGVAITALNVYLARVHPLE